MIEPAIVAECLIATSHGLQGLLSLPSPSPPRAGDTGRLTITLRDTRDDAGAERRITDLEPYLGAWGHLFVLHEARDEALHAHPDSAATTPGGPTIAFDVLLPRAGIYHLWLQFQHRRAIVTMPFVIRVQPRA